jgi:hypothetical protein
MKSLLAFFLAVSLLARNSNAHDVPIVQADLVLRKDGNLDLRVQVPLLQELRRVCGGKRSMTTFLVDFAAMGEQALSDSLRKVESELQREIKVELEAGRPRPSLSWTWPPESLVRKRLSEALRDVLVVGETDLVLPLVEIRAKSHVRAVDGGHAVLDLPPSFGPADISVYLPEMEAEAPSW